MEVSPPTFISDSYTKEGQNMAGLVKRGDTYHLRMRVPRRYASVMPGKHEIQRSLRTGDEKLARAQLLVKEQQILAELDLLLAGRSSPPGQGSISRRSADSLLPVALFTARQRNLPLVRWTSSFRVLLP